MALPTTQISNEPSQEIDLVLERQLSNRIFKICNSITENLKIGEIISEAHCFLEPTTYLRPCFCWLFSELLLCPRSLKSPNLLHLKRLIIETMITHSIHGGSKCSDRLSNLHESISSHILSRLPTKDAVRTSILSKYWKYKWMTFIYHVDIVSSSSRADHKNDTLFNFVDKIVQSGNNLKTFLLIFEGIHYDIYHLERSICDLLKQNIESLKLTDRKQSIRPKTEYIVLPCSLLNKSSLKILRLFIPCTISIATNHSFLQLTSLELRDSRILIENSSGAFILNFPVLEKFEAWGCEWLNVKVLKICAPLLNTFVTQPKDDYKGEYDGSIEITGTRFLMFKCYGFPHYFTLTGFTGVSVTLYEHSSLQTYSRKNIGIKVRKLLDGISTLNQLSLSYSFVKALQSGPPLHQHDEIKILNLSSYGIATEHLFEFLRMAPSLKVLSVNVNISDEYDYDAVESIPPCIVSHLEEVELRGFLSSQNLAKFLLKNGQVLRKIKVFGYCHLPREEIIRKLSPFPRISTPTFDVS